MIILYKNDYSNLVLEYITTFLEDLASFKAQMSPVKKTISKYAHTEQLHDEDCGLISMLILETPNELLVSEEYIDELEEFIDEIYDQAALDWALSIL